MPRFILIRPTVWPQYTNVTDRQDRQRSDSIGWTVLQTVNPKTCSSHFQRFFSLEWPWKKRLVKQNKSGTL